MQVHIGTPSCSAYDAATGILCIAGRASNSKGEPHVSLWRIKLGTKPVMLAQHGRPAKQPWMRPARRRAERWSACINSESKIVLVATINQPLYIFTWQVCLIACHTTCAVCQCEHFGASEMVQVLRRGAYDTG